MTATAVKRAVKHATHLPPDGLDEGQCDGRLPSPLSAFQMCAYVPLCAVSLATVFAPLVRQRWWRALDGLGAVHGILGVMAEPNEPLTSQDWIDEAYRAIEEGEALSVRNVASQLGATTGSFYHHFAGRNALVLELNRRHLTVSYAFLDRADAVSEPRERLRAFVHDVFSSESYLRADLAMERERDDLGVDKMSREGEERIDRWIHQVLVDIGFDSETAFRQISLMRITHLGMATSIVSHKSAWTAEDRDQMATTLTRAVLAVADC